MANKKSCTACCLYMFMLLIVLAACAKDIPIRPAKDGYIECGEESRTWDGSLCVKHGTCNRPCRAEGYDGGYCATFPWLTKCCCTRNCGAKEDAINSFYKLTHRSTAACP